jgi:hypothetical protein
MADISGLNIDVDEHGDENAQIITLIKNLAGLTPVQRGALVVRYKNVEAAIHRRARRYAFFFHNGRFTVTVGSLLVPALISIQNSGIVAEVYVYWSAWVISLLVSICNGLISLIKIDKKYYFLYCVLEMLHTETWQYLALSGRYSDGCHGYADATHENQYVYFFHALERIKVKQVEEEYYKLTDMHTQTQARKKGGTSAAAGLGVEKRTDEESSEKGDDVGSGSVGGGDFEGMNVPTPAPGQAQAQAQAQTQVKVDQGQAQKKNKVSIIEIGRR